jgi:Poly(R)-hydroxyalkanoic acid synthase subunit (PHA_synth_III_E)
MTKSFGDGSAESVYNFWLGLIPQFFSQIGVKLPAGHKAAEGPAANAMPPIDWLGPWQAAMPFLAGMPGMPAQGAATGAAQTMLAPWAAMFTPYPSVQGKTDPPVAAPGAVGMLGPWAANMSLFSGAGGADAGAHGASAAMQPLQATQQAWLDFMTRFGGASPQSYMTGFDRTFGGLFDALGFGPMRKLQAAFQELAAASLEQNQARAGYAMIVQGAFAAGLERLMAQLAKMADEGERVESVLLLLKMWAMQTEEAVHEQLQSAKGLAATAAMTRAGLSHRRKLQQVAAIVADSLDMATRRELDEVYREIHELKRELRSLRTAAPSRPSAAAKSAKPAAEASRPKPRARPKRRKTRS